MWEALATFVVDWFPHRRNMRLYRGLSSVPLRFQIQEAGSSSRNS
jgi:hypothetical protein